MDPDTDGGVVVSAGPGGSVLNSSKFTVNDISISGLLVKFTVHVRVTLDPKGGMGWSVLLDNFTEVGAGTANDNTVGNQM